MSFFMLGGELSRSAGPIIILSAISAWGLNKTYRLIPFGIGMSILLYFATKNISLHLDNIQDEKKEINLKKEFYNFLPTLGIIMGIGFFRAIIRSSLTLYLPTYLTKNGLSLLNAGFYLSAFQFSGAIGTFLAGHFSDKIGRKNTLLLLSIAVPPLSFIFLMTSGILQLFALVTLGLFIFGATPVFLALVHDAKSQRPSFVNGLYMGSSFITGSIAVMIVGTLGDKIGLNETFLIAAGLSVFSIPFALMVKNR
jgi:FSR family fosmidomycin resistance protein-like MFS transporter